MSNITNGQNNQRIARENYIKRESFLCCFIARDSPTNQTFLIVICSCFVFFVSEIRQSYSSSFHARSVIITQLRYYELECNTIFVVVADVVCLFVSSRWQRSTGPTTLFVGRGYFHWLNLPLSFAHMHLDAANVSFVTKTWPFWAMKKMERITVANQWNFERDGPLIMNCWPSSYQHVI